jgi:dihydrofolate reductase
MISLIVAMDETGVIGNGNSLPWGKLPEDMRHFREKTLGKTVLMGRKTYQSLNEVPLKDRKNIVFSRSMLTGNGQYFYEADKNLLVTQTTDIVWKFATAGEVVVIGGAEIYKQFINLADVIYITQIHEVFEGDTEFPLEMIDYLEWEEVETRYFEADVNNPHSMTFRTLKRLV